VDVNGGRLREIRRKQMLSLRELANVTGMSHDGIQKLEAGRRQAQPRTVRKLAEALGVEPEELVKMEE